MDRVILHKLEVAHVRERQFRGWVAVSEPIRPGGELLQL
jgi:hypothetical protein